MTRLHAVDTARPRAAACDARETSGTPRAPKKSREFVQTEERRPMHRRQPMPSRVKHGLIHHLQLASVRDTDWVAARFGHR